MQSQSNVAKLRSESEIELNDIETGAHSGEEGSRGWENNQGQGRSDVVVEHHTEGSAVSKPGIEVTKTFSAR